MIYLAEFKDAILFDGNFIDSKFPLIIGKELCGLIHFPKLKQESDELVNPLPDNCQLDLDDWGSIAWGNHNEIKTIYIKAFLIEILGESTNPRQTEAYFKQWVNRLLKSIHILNPYFSSNRVLAYNPGFLSQFSQADCNLSFQTEYRLHINNVVCVSCDDFLFCLTNIENELTLQYDLLYRAVNYHLDEDYRNELLNYATIIDITLKQKLQEKLDSDEYEKEAIESIKNCTGYRSFITNMALLKIPIYRSETIDKIMTIRNKVIHEGLYKGNPLKENDLNGFYNEVRNFLTFYKIKMFENEICLPLTDNEEKTSIK